MAALLISIRPEFAEPAYSGIKKFEYRRCRVGAARGDIALVYETAPVMRITGHFTIGDVLPVSADDASALEPNLDIAAKVARYLQGSSRASALRISDATLWKNPRKLSELFPAHRPPQSYYLLKSFDHELLRRSQRRA